MNTQLKALAFVLSLTAVGQAGARTWTVEQNGSGDWLTIQPAVDAAANGDTILIGAGRYDQLHPSPYDETSVVYWNIPKSLVFIGVDVDSVIIGPISYLSKSNGVFCEASATQEFRSISFCNLFRGLIAVGSLVLNDCRFLECGTGVSSHGIAGVSSVSITDCRFIGRSWEFSSNSMSLRNAAFALVENCSTSNMELYLQGMADSMVRNCTFANTFYSSAIAHYISNGTIEDNEITGTVSVSGPSNVTLRDNVCHESSYVQYPSASTRNLYIDDSRAVVQAYGNIFHGASNATILLAYGSTLSGTGNHFLKGSGPWVVELAVYPNANQIDLTNNYWGTTDTAEIASWIYDQNDDPVNIKGTVLFEPFSDIPLPVEEKSLGSVKSMFR